MSRHTPGPRTPTELGSVHCGDERGNQVACVMARGNGGLEQKANTRLIAAAPEMLEALNEAVTNGEWSEGEQCGDWCISKDVYETLRDAIIKAEGVE